MHDGMPYGRNQGQGQGHSREVDRQSPTGLIVIFYYLWIMLVLCYVMLLQHSCVYVKRDGQFHASQAQQQLDELAKHRTPVCSLLCSQQ